VASLWGGSSGSAGAASKARPAPAAAATSPPRKGRPSGRPARPASTEPMPSQSANDPPTAPPPLPLPSEAEANLQLSSTSTSEPVPRASSPVDSVPAADPAEAPRPSTPPALLAVAPSSEPNVAGTEIAALQERLAQRERQVLTLTSENASLLESVHVLRAQLEQVCRESPLTYMHAHRPCATNTGLCLSPCVCVRVGAGRSWRRSRRRRTWTWSSSRASFRAGCRRPRRGSSSCKRHMPPLGQGHAGRAV
jgi:hypothetical protein